MNKKNIIIILLAIIAMTGQAQEERIDTVIPKFLSNGYFFREKAGEIIFTSSDSENNDNCCLSITSFNFCDIRMF